MKSVEEGEESIEVQFARFDRQFACRSAQIRDPPRRLDARIVCRQRYAAQRDGAVSLWHGLDVAAQCASTAYELDIGEDDLVDRNELHRCGRRGRLIHVGRRSRPNGNNGN